MVHSLSSSELLPYLAAHPHTLLLDVRTPPEFQVDHLNGAVNLPLNLLSLRLEEVPREKEIVVYCMHGVRSGQAAHFLMANGYPTVSHLAGGLEDFRAWEKAEGASS